jgi:AraC family transcriptional regulator
MIATLCRANPLPGSQPPAWLRQAHELVRDQFTQPLSVSAIAGAVGVHPVHLARSFRRYYGAPIGDYVRSLRLEKARTLLSSTALTLAEIAIGAGFYDQSHLARAFRRYLGMTPRQYRRLTQLSAAELHG